jgi:hypothetical protein
VEFVVEPLPAPAIVRPEHERQALYVRLTAPRAPTSRLIAVLPEAGAAVRATLEAAREQSEPVRRAVIVGVDAALMAAAAHRELALSAFVDVVRALTDAGVPFLWRTRAGIEAGGLPPALALRPCCRRASVHRRARHRDG